MDNLVETILEGSTLYIYGQEIKIYKFQGRMFYNDILIANIFLRLEGLKGKNDIGTYIWRECTCYKDKHNIDTHNKSTLTIRLNM